MAGSLAPLVIVIVLKTLFDVVGAFVVPIVKSMMLASKDNKVDIKT